MTKPPAFQFYPKEFLSDINVMQMTLEELGAYWKLCSVCWIEDGLPTDTEKLARLLKVPPKKMLSLWEAIGPCFRERDGRLVHPRLDEERQKQEAFREKMSAAGKKGGRPKVIQDESLEEGSGNPKERVGFPNEKGDHKPQKALQSASATAKKQKPPNPLAGVVVEVFEYWRSVSGHVTATLTSDRRKKIEERLVKFSPEQLKRAVDGACANPFYRGQNDRNERYDWPETIFKQDSTVEKHMSYEPNGNGSQNGHRSADGYDMAWAEDMI